MPTPDRPAAVRTRDGLALPLRHWTTGGAAHGTVLLVHGLGEHIGRYAHVAAHLTARGWDVTGYDQRGHGAAPGKRGVLRAADDLLDDLGRVLGAVRTMASAFAGTAPDATAAAPLVLIGHSMGGLVAAQFVAEGRGAVDALVLSSPALDAGLSFAQRVQLAVGHALVPDLAMGNQLDAERISHDPAVVAAYQADPLVHDRVSARLARALVDGGALVRARAAAWTVPTLLLWAGDDRLVAPAGSAAFAAAAPPAVVTARRFDGLWHELFNELDRAPVFDALDAWMERTVPRRA